MCGIAGIINFKNESVSKSNIKKMTDAIAHRGPDGEGQFTDKNVGLGHRRLSVIDLSEKASQPMVSHDNNFIIVYNGEIYNFQAIRKELEIMGYHFQSTSDTEVLLYSYIEWGIDCLPRFNGIFAVAIYDRINNKLFMARDRYGTKPLYYAIQDGIFYFASEQKGITSVDTFKKELDYEGLLEYFTFQNFFTNHTLDKNIKLFPAGSYCEISTIHRIEYLEPKTFWDFSFIEPEQPLAEEEYIEELDRLFSKAVKSQLVSDVDVGAYLSGGMDSGSITAIAAKQLPYMKSFTCGFDLNSASGLELAFDERQKAEYMSYLYKTEHYEMVLKSGDMERIMSKLVYHIEEPRVGQSYPNMYAAQLASKFVKVVLSGAGGDELFGGYPWRYYRATVNTCFEDYIDKYYGFWQRLIPNSEIKKVFSPIWDKVSNVWTRDIFRDVFKNHQNKLETPEDYINHSMYFEAKTFLQGILIVDDKLSMAYGLETRVPFLDNDLVDFATKIPVNMKLRNLHDIVRINENEHGDKTNKYFQKTNDGKIILRKVMSKYIPEEINNATKQGFSAPDESWFRGESIDFVKRSICSRDAKIYDLFDFNETQKLVNEHLEGKANRRLLIWGLLSFNELLANA